MPKSQSQKKPKTLIQGRITERAFANFQKYGELHNLKGETEILEHTYRNLFGKEHQDISQDFLSYPKCEFYSEYPPEPNYIKCRKEGYWKIVTRQSCQACSLYSEIRVPLMRREKLEKEIKKLKENKKELIAEVEKLKNEYQAYDVLELQSKLKSAFEILEEKDKEIATLQTDNEYLREQIQFSKIQHQLEPKAKHQDRVMERPQYIEKTVEKVAEKIVYKDRLEGLQIRCKAGKGFVSLTEECGRNCKDFMECPYYSSIFMDKKIPDDAKLRYE